MKTIFILLVFTFATHLVFSQVKIDKRVFSISTNDSAFLADTNLVTTLDPIYFVLGTLSDYMGRFRYVDKEKQIDRYYPIEKDLVDYLTEYIDTSLNLKVDTFFKSSKHSTMYSNELAKELNSFYGENDKLLSDKFVTDRQKYSFLTGVYLRNGEKLDSSIHKIQLANSPKHEICYSLLKQIGCEKIFYKYLRNIPAQFILYFEASAEFENYLALIKSENQKLHDARRKYMTLLMEGADNFKELERSIESSKNQELKRIRSAFN